MSIKPGMITLSAIVLATADELIKFIALQKLPPEGSFELNKIVDFTIHKNYGIAFDLHVAKLFILIFSAILTIIFIILFIRTMKRQPAIAAASALIIAGALGNMFDRVVYGFTVDYLILFGRSAINISDLLILSGVIWLLFSGRRKNYKPLTPN